MIYCWPSVGWYVGVVKEANGDKRRKMNGDVITLEKYGGEDVGAWVLLAALDQVHQERSEGEEATE